MSFYSHPRALVESDRIGARTRIWAFAHVMEGAIVGEDCNLGDGVFVESGVVVGDRVTLKNHVLLWDGVTIADDVFVGPNVVFTNDLRPRPIVKVSRHEWLATRVDLGASIGANATIVCGIRIGKHAMVGAGSVVTRDVLDYQLVYGNPARPRGWVCLCGAEIQSGVCLGECGRAYEESDSGLVEVATG